MAQSLIEKRRKIALDTMDATIRLRQALKDLETQKEERSVAGDFTDADLDRPELQHLSPAAIATWIDVYVAALLAWVADPANPGRKQVMLEMIP